MNQQVILSADDIRGSENQSNNYFNITLWIQNCKNSLILNMKMTRFHFPHFY